VPKNTATKKPAKKPAKTSARKNGLHYTSDPGFRIKERPSIEDLIKENK
jgi:hypothetical protein